MKTVLTLDDSSPEKRQEGKDAGATGWIIKPFTPAQLLSVVQEVTR